MKLVQAFLDSLHVFEMLFRFPGRHTRLDCPDQYFSRKTRFRILPDPDLGSSSVMNSIWRGTLYEAVPVFQFSLSFSPDKMVSGGRKTAAAPTSPHFSSVMPNTAASFTSGIF